MYIISETERTALLRNLVRSLDCEGDITWNNLWPVPFLLIPHAFSPLPPPVDAIYNEHPAYRGTQSPNCEDVTSLKN